MSDTGSPAGSATALVIQQRVTDAGATPYALCLTKIGERLRTWPGFTRQEVIPPNPPTQVDWIVVDHFTSSDAARAWIQSPDRTALLAEARPFLVGQEDMHLLAEENHGQPAMASVVISHAITPEDEPAFLEWQREIQATEAKFKGFVRHKIERPVPGVQDRWVTVLTFDSDQTLDVWLTSAERSAMIAKGERFNRDLSIRRSSYGFDFWFPTKSGPPRFSNHVIMKQNLIVLLILYPVVFLWGYFIGGPILGGAGVPFWLALFIGNVASTQLLGWLIAPWAFSKFEWWVTDDTTVKQDILGYAIVIALYIVSMAVYAGLLALH